MEQMGMFGQPKKIVSKVAHTGVIYETAGKAREYRELACNLYRGCGHFCLYCYAPGTLRMERNVFDNPSPRPDILRKIEQDARYFGSNRESRQVLFCFTCDPYQPINDQHKLTRRAIEICHRNGLNICILSKAGTAATQDLDLLTAKDSFAATLTFDNDADSLKYEPSAGLPAQRIEGLRMAHAKGIPTWVSIEPVIIPEQSLHLIQMSSAFVDEFKIGKLNGMPEIEARIDWRWFGREAVALCKSLGKKYYIKKDLAVYL